MTAGIFPKNCFVALVASSELKKTAIYMDLFTARGFSLAGIKNAP
jgi:hypothetical protein